MVTRNRVLLTGAMVMAALLIGLTLPGLVPALAAANSTSVVIGNPAIAVLPGAVDGSSTITINGTAISQATSVPLCQVKITQASNLTAYNSTAYTIAECRT